MSINVKKYTKQELRPFPERYHELRKVTYSRR